MDWYYPVLSGVVTGEMGIKHLAEKNETFEIPVKVFVASLIVRG